MRATLARCFVRLTAAVLLLAALGVLAAGVIVPRLTGATPYTVLSGSMRPEVHPGDLVVVRPVDFDDIRTGSVITYQLVSGEPTTVTHRVVGRSVTGDDEPALVTRGDANDEADEQPVREVQVRGELWYVAPWLGHVSTWASPEQRLLATRVLAGCFAAYAVVVLLVGRRRRHAATRTHAAGPDSRSSAEPAT